MECADQLEAALAALVAPQPQECETCKHRNVLLLAMSGHLDKVRNGGRGYDGVECVRLHIEELKSRLAPPPQTEPTP